jgi:hypothetical protein
MTEITGTVGAGGTSGAATNTHRRYRQCILLLLQVSVVQPTRHRRARLTVLRHSRIRVFRAIDKTCSKSGRMGDPSEVTCRTARGTHHGDIVDDVDVVQELHRSCIDTVVAQRLHRERSGVGL